MKDLRPSQVIDDIADRFEAAWKAGEAPSIAGYLDGCPEEYRSALTAELVRIDVAYCLRRGLVPTVDDYRDYTHFLQNPEELLVALKVETARLSTAGQAGDSSIEVVDGRFQEPGDDLPAPLKLGRFVLEQPLGSGVFGMVYRAVDPELKRDVAVKVMRGASFAGPEQRQRFFREARNVAQLRHPAIVAIHEASQCEGIPFMVTDLIEGTTLKHALAERQFDFRDSARLIAAIARGLDHAHQHRVIHRDVKPANILLDETGQPLITDFGLAKHLAAGDTMTEAGQVLGTPAYMSPEQASGRIEQLDGRSDVYSLGVVLYEMLTGERPFRGELRMLLQQVRHDEPRPPRRLDDRIPRDLETICLTALSKTPAGRYQTAGQMADDLERFLRGEMILARPLSKWVRSARYCRRHWRVVVPAALAVVVLTALALIVVQARIAEANLRALHAEDQADQFRREALFEKIYRLTSAVHFNGWREEMDEVVKQAAAIRRDDRLRNYATATLDGLDARVEKLFPGLNASSVAFDPTGQVLLLGGRDQPAQRYHLKTDAIESLGLAAPGPVIHTSGGRSLQLAITGADSCALHDLNEGRTLREFNIPDLGERDRLAEAMHRLPLAAIAGDGSVIAAAARRDDQHGVVIAWDAISGEQVASWEGAASAIALTPDGHWLAIGDEQGTITIHPIHSPAESFTLRAGRVKISALAFHVNPRRRPATNGSMPWQDPWLMASGDEGGSVKVWNPQTGALVAECGGSMHWITSLCFNPDATLLAGGAHSEVLLWDIATGHCVLRLVHLGDQSLQWVSGVTFSPDGERLAISSLPMFVQGVTAILELENGRGISALRGMSSEISRVAFSPDDRLVAALSHQWELGIWRVSDKHLVRLLEFPIGYTVDNAALAISPDGRWIAASTYREARLWEIESGELISTWTLPPGLQDELVFAPDGNLYSLRFETRSRNGDEEPEPWPPLSFAAPRDFARVCRFRRLNTDRTTDLIRESEALDWHIERLALSPDASCFVGMGLQSDGAGIPRRATLAIDLASGTILASDDTGAFSRCRTGLLLCKSTSAGQHSYYELPSNRLLKHASRSFPVVGAGHRYALGSGPSSGGISVYSFDTQDSIVTLARYLGCLPELSLDETMVVWAGREGQLRMAHLPTIQRNLARFGLGW